ncbi:MAG: mechanosensitive ion channel family protein [Patescibacteria group bacterium]
MDITELYNQLADVTGSTPMRLLITILALFVFKQFGMVFISRGVRKAINPDMFATAEDETQREDTLISILDAIFNVGLYIIGAMLILSQLGVEIGPLIAGVSFAGIAVGFGAQNLVKDLVAGLFIILENQYRVNDVVTIAGTTGVVEDITLRQTTLRDLDGKKHFVPNGSIDVATNLTMDYSNVHINVGIAYDSDIAKVEKIVNKVGEKLSGHKDLGEFILEPPKFIRVDNFGASDVEIKILGKVTPGEQWVVAGEFRQALLKEFAKNNIEIPFPQRVIHKSK